MVFSGLPAFRGCAFATCDIPPPACSWPRASSSPKSRCCGLPQGTQTVFLQPRDGSLRMPAQNFVDMRFEKRFRLGPASKITLMADIINVLNIDTPLTWISEVATSSNFACPT
jgi:hypothetical protein